MHKRFSVHTDFDYMQRPTVLSWHLACAIALWLSSSIPQSPLPRFLTHLFSGIHLLPLLLKSTLKRSAMRHHLGKRGSELPTEGKWRTACSNPAHSNFTGGLEPKHAASPLRHRKEKARMATTQPLLGSLAKCLLASL